MFNNPLHIHPHGGLGTPFSYSGHHERKSSASSVKYSSPNGAMPAPPPSTPVVGLYGSRGGPMQDDNSCYDLGSRSSSEYNSSSATFQDKPPAYPGIAAEPAYRRQLEIRLPSDQLQKIISAVSPPRESQRIYPASSMPPPPLPLHALAARQGEGWQPVNTPITSSPGQRVAAAVVAFENSRRGESRSSDISMHTGCDVFPSCTSEDERGQIQHSSPVAPSTVIRGKKEGASPVKGWSCMPGQMGRNQLTGPPARDFMSTIMGPQLPETRTPTSSIEQQPSMLSSMFSSSSPAAEATGTGTGKKRTRAALRSLTLNDGSPQKKGSEATKPPRKSSRASSNSSNKENTAVKNVVEKGAAEVEKGGMGDDGMAVDV